MKRILKIIMLLFPLVIVGQAEEFVWTKAIVGYEIEQEFGVAVDDSGNVYSTGMHKGEGQFTADFDPGPGVVNSSNLGSRSAHLVKLDSLGSYVWAKWWGGSNCVSVGKRVEIDNSGDLIVAGVYMGPMNVNTVQGNVTLPSSGMSIFILKLNSSGDVLWAKAIEGDMINNVVLKDQVNAIAIDVNDNIYIAGTFQGTVDFDPGQGVNSISYSGGTDVFILKLTSNGDFEWVKTIGGQLNENATSLGISSVGEIYIGGSFQGQVDMDPGTGVDNHSSAGFFKDIYILKLDLNGDYLWCKTIEGQDGDDECTSIAISSEGEVISCGYFVGTSDFDPGPGVYNLTGIVNNGDNHDGYILKLEANGDFEWGVKIDSRRTSTQQFIAHQTYHDMRLDVDSLGSVYTIGHYQGTVDFDPGVGIYSLTSTNSFVSFQPGRDAFIQKIDSLGNFIWVKTLGGPKGNEINDISLGKDGSILVVGGFMDTMYVSGASNLDLGDEELGIYATYGYSSDVFIAKLKDCEIDTAISVISGLILESNSDNSVYQWINCDSNSVIQGENDQSFTPSVNGNYAVVVTKHNCSDTSECINVSAINIQELDDSKFYVFPNPSSGEFILKSTELNNATLVLKNLAGQIVYVKKQICGSQNQFSIDIANGIYMIELYHLGEKRQFKMIVH